jgi:hypothetical protein
MYGGLSQYYNYLGYSESNGVETNYYYDAYYYSSYASSYYYDAYNYSYHDE